jgi:hypothetical protein
MRERLQFALNRSSVDGLHWYCRECQRGITAEKKGKYTRDSYDDSLWTMYRIRRHDFDRMMIEQSGLCAVCDVQLYRPCIDHCHQTGKVRGLLCNSCNTLMAAFDKPGFLEAAMKYHTGNY